MNIYISQRRVLLSRTCFKKFFKSSLVMLKCYGPQIGRGGNAKRKRKRDPYVGPPKPALQTPKCQWVREREGWVRCWL